MKRIWSLALITLLIFSVSFTLADDTIINETSNVERAFACLEEKVGPDCKEIENVREIALTILAKPDNVYNGCVKKLQTKIKNDNLGSVRDTALGVLALKHAGKDYDELVEWLEDQVINSNDIIWYLQQDSEEASKCSLKYNSTTSFFEVKETKKIESVSLGECFSPTSSKFWLEVIPKCYEKEFEIGCDKGFIANLLYFNKKNPEVVFVSDNTQEGGANEFVKLKVNSKCFTSGSSKECSFEDTIWGAYVLSELNKDTSAFLPYITAMAEDNKGFSPYVFLYLLNPLNSINILEPDTNTEIGFWHKKAYDKYYDTSLVLLVLGINQEQTRNAENAIWFNQGDNGCWVNSVKDTAMILWATEQRQGLNEPTTAKCEDAGFICVPSLECSVDDDLGDKYFCEGTANICCNKRPVTCKESGGQICEEGKVCSTTVKKTEDTDSCCLGSCNNPEVDSDDPEEECVTAGFKCLTSCDSKYYEEVSYACDGNSVCCKRFPSSDPEEDSVPWWIWVLIIAIVVALGIIVYVYREQIKLLLFKSKSKMGKGPVSNNPSNGSVPPGYGGRPPMPPGRYRAPPRRMPPQRMPMSQQQRPQ